MKGWYSKSRRIAFAGSGKNQARPLTLRPLHLNTTWSSASLYRVLVDSMSAKNVPRLSNSGCGSNRTIRPGSWCPTCCRCSQGIDFSIPAAARIPGFGHEASTARVNPRVLRNVGIGCFTSARPLQHPQVSSDPKIAHGNGLETGV